MKKIFFLFLFIGSFQSIFAMQNERTHWLAPLGELEWKAINALVSYSSQWWNSPTPPDAANANQLLDDADDILEDSDEPFDNALIELGNPEDQEAALADQGHIVHDFLCDHGKFKALWGTAYKDVNNLLAQNAIAPSLPMLRKVICDSAFQEKIRIEKDLKSLPAWRKIKFDPEFTLCAIKDSHNNVHIKDLATGELVHIYATDVQNMSFNHDGTQLIIEQHNNNMKAVNTKTGKCTVTLPGRLGKCSPDNLLIATSSGNTAKIVNSTTGTIKHALLGHGGNIYRLEFSPNGDFLATGAHDWCTKIWNLKTGTCFLTLTDNPSKLRLIEFDATSSLLLTQTLIAGTAGSAKIWDMNGVCIQTIPCCCTLFPGNEPSKTVRFNPDGTKIALVTPTRDKVEIWEVAGNCLHTLQGHASPLVGLSFDHSGKSLITYSDDGIIKVWDMASSICTHTLDCLDKRNISGPVCPQVHLSPLGMLTATIVKNHARVIRIWDLSGKEKPLIHHIEKKLTLGQALLLNCICETQLTHKMRTKREDHSFFYRILFRPNGVKVLTDPKAYWFPYSSVVFSFAQHPELQDYFTSLPPEIQAALKSFVKLE